jgi:hypothetical protein
MNEDKLLAEAINLSIKRIKNHRHALNQMIPFISELINEYSPTPEEHAAEINTIIGRHNEIDEALQADAKRINRILEEKYGRADKDT